MNLSRSEGKRKKKGRYKFWGEKHQQVEEKKAPPETERVSEKDEGGKGSSRGKVG